MNLNADKQCELIIQEEWRAIADVDSYFVSNLGRIKWRNRIRKPTANSQGYLRVNFWISEKSKSFSVAGLVASAFIGVRPDREVIRHLNGICSDNRAKNLCYGTSIENEADKVVHGTKAQGVTHGANKLTEAQVVEIRRRYIPRDSGNHIRALATDFGVSTKTIHQIILRKIWKHIQ